MKSLYWLFLLPLLFASEAFSQKSKVKKKAVKHVTQRFGSGYGSPGPIDGHPYWIMQGNIYEVNVRQYTQEGTFNAFAKHLDRLKDMGVQTLWFMPINPISKKDRKGTLGSYYAVADYTAINPEFGNMDDWKSLVKLAHSKGMKVIIDWVPNHTGADHGWLYRHPDFFRKDSTGHAAVAFDWVDTRQLDYNNKELQDSMTASMAFWIKNSDIDGFRCDVAGEVPDKFWSYCIPQLRKLKYVFMLAEADKPSVHVDGFDASYGWDYFAMTKRIAAGERPAFAIDSVLARVDAKYPPNALKMLFTSNHDENSWNRADYETMPGEIHAPFAVLTQTMKRNVPLIYSGQEEPVLRKIEFFEKDPITLGKFARAEFYKTLLNLRKRNAALASNASFRKVFVGDSSALYAFVREKAGKKVFVVVNLSSKPQQVTISDKTLWGTATNVFIGDKQQLSGTGWNIEPWGYAVYEY